MLGAAALALAAVAPAAASQTLSPASWNFGTLAIGQTSVPKSFTLTLTCRPSDDGTIPCQYPEYLNPVIATSGDYAVVSEDCPANMAAGPSSLGLPFSQSCTITATFGPTGGGVRPGTLETGGPRATLTGFAPLPPTSTPPATVAKAKRCKKKAKRGAAAAKRCKRKGR